MKCNNLNKDSPSPQLQLPYISVICLEGYCASNLFLNPLSLPVHCKESRNFYVVLEQETKLESYFGKLQVKVNFHIFLSAKKFGEVRLFLLRSHTKYLITENTKFFSNFYQIPNRYQPYMHQFTDLSLEESNRFYQAGSVKNENTLRIQNLFIPRLKCFYGDFKCV